MEKFIDVSYHKGYMDFQKVKDSGITGVVMKCSDGFFMPDNMNPAPNEWTQHTDPTFKLYWKQLKDLFEWRACYHFLRVDDEIAQANGRPTSLEQIDYFYNQVVEEGLEWDDIIILDIEQVFSQLDYLNKATVASRVKKAIQKTEELFGRKPLIYTGAWWWEYYDDYMDTTFMYKYPFWLSHYWAIDANNEVKYNGYYYNIYPERIFPYEWLDNLNERVGYCRLPMLTGGSSINRDKVLAWQYSSSGRVNGITSNVDMNYYVTQNGWEDWSECLGEEPVEPPVDPPEPPEPPETGNGILEYILKILQALVAAIVDWINTHTKEKNK